MIIYFATSNAGKVTNAQAALKPFGILVKQLKVDLVESRAEDPAEIALEKAKQAYTKYKKPLMVEDSGFFIEALGGFPMTHIKFSLKTMGVDGILRAMRGAKSRACEWRMTVAYVYGPGKHKTFTFVEKGVIAHKPHPVLRPMMSDYWRLYVPKMLSAKNTKALSDMSEGEMTEWMAYFSKNNQFLKLGKWLARR
jgi:XTP/dITP diphosphohydrolase